MGTIKMSGIIISENDLGDYDKMLAIVNTRIRKNMHVWQKALEDKEAPCLPEHSFYALENI